MADNRYWYPINDHIYNAVPIAYSSTLRYCDAQKSDDILQQEQLHEGTQANMPCVGQTMQ